MQICRKSFIGKLSSLLLVLLLSNYMMFSADVNMPDMLEMPDMPAMPSINFDGSFYKPSLPLNMMGSQKSKTEKENKRESVIQNNTNSEDFVTSLLNNDSTLTANDISSLYDSGLFSDLSSLGSIFGDINNINNNQYNTNNETNKMLQDILIELKELKQEQKSASLEELEVMANNQKDSVNFKQRNPSILRFRINGYDINSSLVEVFVSSPEEDGSFLVTADRRYILNNKTRTETFYLLFRAEKNGGATISYNVVPSIAQDYENKNSFIYRLSQIKDLKADKTGNLVVLRYDGGGLKIDLLLDIDKR